MGGLVSCGRTKQERYESDTSSSDNAQAPGVSGPNPVRPQQGQGNEMTGRRDHLPPSPASEPHTDDSVGEILATGIRSTDEAIELGPAESHEIGAVTCVLQLNAAAIGRDQGGGPSSMQSYPASALSEQDSWTLSSQLLRHFEQFGDLSNLQNAISLLEVMVESTSVLDRRYPEMLDKLGIALLHRFQRLGEVIDLDQAISRYSRAVDLSPDDHPHKPPWLFILGNFLFTRFERFGELSDLGQSILKVGGAVNLTPDNDPYKPVLLNHLGNSFLTRFERLGEINDLEQAISKFWDAASHTPDDHPYKPLLINNLGNSYLARFKRLGELSDLGQAILKFTDAVNLIPDNHPDKSRRLSNLGNSLVARFKHLGEPSDLERAKSRFMDAIRLLPDGHPDKPDLLNNFGACFLHSFEDLGDLSDLEQAISMFQDAVETSPDVHPHKPDYLNHLGNCFRARFMRLGELSDLKQAISMHRNAVNLTPDNYPKKPGYLNNLSVSLFTSFERLGELSDLERAISMQLNVVELTPNGHPYKPGCLINLGNSFRARFERLGELGDLNRAIFRQGEAVDLTRDGHPNKPGWLNNLGNSFYARFQRLGEYSDLEQAISMQGDAADLTSDAHPDKPARLNSLGNSLIARFQLLGELSDLAKAISRQRDAVSLAPDGHAYKPIWLINLGSSLRVRFEKLGELSDLEQAILMQGGAVNLTPDGHPDKPGRLNSLGNSLLARFDRLQQLGDIEQGISRFWDAVNVTPDNHPHKPRRLNNLGNSLLTRFQHLGELDDLGQATSKLEDAVNLTPDGHPNKSTYLINLGDCFKERFKHLGQLRDLEQAISLYTYAACSSTGPAFTRFHASLQWISCARISGHHTLIHAYSSAVGLLPQLAWIGVPLANRYRRLIEGADVVREAAAAALDFGYLETAVEWLEQGRSIVWGELLQLRNPCDELSTAHPDRARRLRHLSVELEHAGVAHEKVLSSLSETSRGSQRSDAVSLEQEANRHRMLAIERDKLLWEIRQLPGFERFLLHKEFSQLRASAHSGPVVILNAAESRSDALIVLADVENVIHVPLPNFTAGQTTGVRNLLKGLVRDAQAVPPGERKGQPMPQELSRDWESILSALWKCVVEPVLNALGFSTLEYLSRIFWCPTGFFTFLPIHAAGYYDAQYSTRGHKVFDFVVSSYVPTLSILAPPSEHSAAAGSNLRFLFVHQPPSDGLPHLPGVDAELKHIHAITRNSVQTHFVESCTGTVEEVLDLMKDADWVHFACHGIQDTTNPTKSGLCLADGRRLKLSDIIALSRPRGGLAFLSACQTAKGDARLSDEAVHISAGMLFAGYGGVVGTLWSISDRLAPDVARDVYERLFRDGAGRPDCREAARALQNAVGRLRDGGVSFAEWLPFIHVGL